MYFPSYPYVLYCYLLYICWSVYHHNTISTKYGMIVFYIIIIDTVQCHFVSFWQLFIFYLSFIHISLMNAYSTLYISVSLTGDVVVLVSSFCPGDFFFWMGYQGKKQKNFLARGHLESFAPHPLLLHPLLFQANSYWMVSL